MTPLNAGHGHEEGVAGNTVQNRATKTIQKLTVEQHKQAVKLGIKQRRDGTWGFKKLCAEKSCPKKIEEFCCCTDTFEEAVVKSQERGSYLCSDACVIKDQGDVLWDSYRDAMDDPPEWLTKPSEEGLEAIEKALKAGDLSTLKEEDRWAFDAWLSDEKDNWDGDGGDSDECECELDDE